MLRQGPAETQAVIANHLAGEEAKSSRNQRGSHMGKTTAKHKVKDEAKSIADLLGTASSADPSLEALFKQNAGPLKPLKIAHRVEEVEIDEVEPAEESPPEVSTEPAHDTKPSKKRKRRLEEEKTEDLESRYINKIYSKISQPEPVNVEEPETPVSSDEIDPELLQHETLTPNSDAADRTLFISNVPVKVLTSKPFLRSLKQLFSKHGQISSIRFRSIAFTELVPRKVAYITKTFHPERDTVNAYIVYKSAESVQTAVESLNGVLWEEKHLRVDSVSNPSVHDHKRSVFVGNLPFDVHDEDLYLHFARCGEIEFVRVVRDKKTNIGKGFGYVQFKERYSVDKAVLLNDKPSATIKRPLRVTYAKNEQKIKGNVAAARTRLNKKEIPAGKLAGPPGKGVVEGRRAAKDKSGGSGFKIGKKRGKMRLVETKSR